jgi:hypothetical protein
MAHIQYKFILKIFIAFGLKEDQCSHHFALQCLLARVEPKIVNVVKCRNHLRFAQKLLRKTCENRGEHFRKQMLTFR